MVGLYLSLTLWHVQEIFLITGLLFLSIPVYSIREGLIYVGGRPTYFAQNPRQYCVMLFCYPLFSAVFFAIAFV